jgi:hypothetical protein
VSGDLLVGLVWFAAGLAVGYWRGFLKAVRIVDEVFDEVDSEDMRHRPDQGVG